MRIRGQGRRFGGRVAALVTGALLTATGAAAPVLAAEGPDGQVRLTMDVPEASGLYDADEGAAARFEAPRMLVQPHGGVARNVEITVDARELKGVGTMTPGHRCTGDADVFRCRFDPRSLRYATHFSPFYLRGEDGAAPGDGGTVHITARADNAASVRADMRMEVQPPDLTSIGVERVPGLVKPGAPVELRPGLANESNWPVERFALRMSTYGRHLTVDQKYRNCWYPDTKDETRDQELNGSELVWCEFDTPLPPHSAWRIARPMAGHLDADMPAESVRYQLPYAIRDKAAYPHRGSGPELKLERVPTSDIKSGVHKNAWGSLIVRGTAQVDYAPIVEGPVRGRVGETVKVRIGARNVNGGKLPGINPDRVEIVPPEGTTITGTPYMVDGDPIDDACKRPAKGSRAWRCGLGSEAFEQIDGREGARTTVTVRIRIDDDVPGARGTVRVVGKYDRTHGNDSAALRTDIDGRERTSPLAIGGAVAGGAVVVVGGLVLARRYRRNRRG
ncbi:hypothetical protein ACOKM3_02695 [Streptomyces sp. BH106]|uniref:hypothetical protein n=1 Tax=Streptomyces sp. BH106 TaxID=3410409 RepID=UPI003CE74228